MEEKAVRKRKKTEESFTEKIERMFEYGLDTEGHSEHPFLRISDMGIARDIYFGSTITDIDFVTYDEKMDDHIKIATMELRTGLFKNEYEMIDVADENTDFRATANVACQYDSKCKNHLMENCSNNGQKFYLCEIHTLYVSEEFRGNGLAKYFLMMVPGIVDGLLNYEHYNGIIATHINPWVYQGTLNKELSKITPLTYINNPDDETIKKMQKPLIEAGFKKINERDFCISNYKLKEFSRKKGLDFSYKGYRG